MNDLISRQAAIDAYIKYTIDYLSGSLKRRPFTEILRDLPPAQPELVEKAAYIRGFEQGRTQGTIDTKAEGVAQPTADVVEVVRCKDCKHYKRNIPWVGGHYNGCDEWLDEGNPITVYDNDFCSYGERKEE